MYSDRPAVEAGKNAPSKKRSAHEVFPNCFLGPKESVGSKSLDGLKAKGVRCVINCTPDEASYHETELCYARVAVHDEDSADITEYFEAATFLMHQYLTRGDAVVVHCQRGVSRSATIVLAYLIKYKKLTRNQAYINVKSLRPQADPNPGFWRQLLQWEKQCLEEKKTDSKDDFKDDSKGEEQEFEWDWAENSFARYCTLRNWDDGNKDMDLFPEIYKYLDALKSNPATIIETCLDFIYGRSLNDEELGWISKVVRIIGPEARTCAQELLDKESEWFTDKWCGEYYEEKVNCILTALRSMAGGLV